MQIEENNNNNTTNSEFVLDEQKFELYYKHYFPIKTFVQWLTYDQENQSAQSMNKEIGLFKRREFSFTYPGDVYQRYQSFKDQSEFQKALIERKPEKIDIGAVFTKPPNKNDTNIPSEREFVIDIDMTDYDDVRSCCTGANICLSCWEFMKAAGHVLCQSLKEDFGFENILWVYSGRRGIHLWVCDSSLRGQANAIRSAVIDNLNLIPGGEKSGTKIKSGLIQWKKMHYQMKRAYKTLSKYFEKIEQTQQIFKNKPSIIQGIIETRDEKLWEVFAKHMKDLSEMEPKQMLQTIDDIIEDIQADKSQKIKNTQFLKEEIVVSLLYPRIDVNVSKTMNHLLKAPFSIHPKTGRICVPFTDKQFDSFNPFTVPSMEQLHNHYYNQNPSKQQVKFDDSPLVESVQIFQDFVNTITQNESQLNKDRSYVASTMQSRNGGNQLNF